MSRQRSVCVVTGSRADYGLLRPVMEAVRADPELSLQVLVTGMHLAHEFGYTVTAIESDGFHIDARVDSQLAGDTGVSVGKSVGLGTIGFADTLARLRPDIIVVLGDRYEILAAVVAALFLRIPVAHIAGGDITEAAYDDAIRHSITKMAHVHFTTNSESALTVKRLGEEPERIHNVGSPALDLMRKLPRLNREELQNALGFAFRTRNLLITFHPITLDQQPATEQFAELLGALDHMGPEVGLIFTYPNADDGGRALISMVEKFVATHTNAIAFPSLGMQRYFSLLAQVDAVVGNSSSGLYEAPSFKIPTVNIGDRQKGRIRAASVIDCPPDEKAILAALERAFTLDCTRVQNPYGDGHTSERIVAVLKSLPPTPELLRKRFPKLEHL